ncbi:hypothetical protein MASR1M107_01580 [Ignavibacteriales bacterium]
MRQSLPVQRVEPAFIELADRTTGYIFASNNIIIKLIDTALTTVEEEPAIPREFTLSQNFPNPFNPETVIRFALPVSGFVKGVVYDILGREVATLINSEKSAGSHEIKFNAAGLPSGIYIFRLQTGKQSAAIKMVVSK